MKKDSIKENIATYRAFSLLLLTSIFGMVGYTLANLEKLASFKLVAGAVIFVILICSFAFLVLKYIKNIQILEGLE